MLTDFGAWENTLDDNQRQQLETTFKYEPDRSAAQKRFASVAFVAANTGQDVEDVSRRFEDYYMHAYARDEKGLGIVGGVKDTNEFHGLLIKRANDNIIKAEKVNQARLTGRESGLSGASMPSELARFQVAYPDATEDEKLAFADTLFQASVKALPYRKLIKEASSKLGKEMESNIPSTGTFQEVASQLLSVPENDRPMVISMIGASGGATAQERAAYLSKLAGAMGRMTESVAASSLNAASDAALYGFLAPLEGQEPDTILPTSSDDEFRILTQQIRQMADAEIAPIKGDGWWSQTGIDVARMAPQMAVTLANPAIGMAANTAYFRDTVAAQAKSEDPNLSYKQAAAIGDVSAPFNAAIETVTALIPFGKIKMPFLQKWLSTATTTIAGTARKFVVRGALGVASEVGEEMAQAVIPLWTQDALAALNKDRSEVDWQRRMPNFSQIAQQTWGPALVFGIVGGGVVSIKDIKNGRALASDVDMMVATGINPETAVKIKAASDDQDYNAADSLFRAEFISETKASKPDIEAATERLKARFKAQENVEALTETTSPEYTASVTRTPSGWQVTTGDGTIIPAETAEGANRIYNGIRQSGSLKEAQVFAETLDAAYASGMARGAAVNLTGETVTSNSRTGLVTAVRIDENKAPIPGSERYFGPGALDTIHKEAEVAGFKSGTQNVSFHINGSNEAFPSRVADTAKGIWRMINIFKSKKDGLPMITTFLHEDIESKFRLGLANGAWSKEDARTAFRALAPAFANIAEPVNKSADEVASMSKASRQKYEEDLDAKKLEYEWVKNVRKIVDGNMDDTLVRETFSEMYVRNAYALDRRGRNTGLPPGQISRALEAAVVGANTNEEASALVRIIAVFRALSAHLKAVFGTVKAMVKARDNGTIGEDWDAFVDKVLGIDEVKRDEGLAINEAQAILEDSNMPFSISPNATVSVPTSDIDTIPEDLARAEADMKAGGKDWAAKVDLSQPVGVYRGEDGRLKLFDGHHRWLAARERGEPLQVRESVIGRAVPIGEAPVVAEMPDGAQLVGPATFSITAYHGTPHKVDKFTTAKIGTGEGVQAFGWGLYFAAAKKVAEGYRSALTNRKKDVFLDGKLVDKKSLTNEEFKAVNMIELFGSAEAAIEAAANPDDAQFIKENAGRIQIKDQGNLYTVELLPDEADFLDWDKPLSEQSEKVKAALAGIMAFDPAPNGATPDGQAINAYFGGGKSASVKLASLGIPGIKYLDGNSRDGGSGTSNYVIFDESLVKILEENGQKVEGQSFSISPIRNLNELSDQVARQFAENPVEALEVKTKVIRQFAKIADKWSNERWTPQGNKIRPISDKRTVKSLDKEQAYRKRARQRELIDEGMNALTPDTLMAWSQGVDTLSKDPLIAKMLNDNGKLMSKSTAEDEGRNIKDQYDDDGWIPPQWYAKAGGIMPDVMANNLGFDTASEMWAALESSIKSHRNAKEGYAKAEAAVKAVEKAAFEQARAEAQAWRDEADAMQKEDWSPKESLVRDLITLEAIVAMFPQEIRGKIGGFVTLARKASESARLKVLQKQLERGQVLLEKHLKDQYGEATDKLLKRYKSQKDASGRITGKILSTATEQVDWAAAVMDMTIEQQSEKSDVLEKIIEEPKDGDDVQDALNRLGILRLFEVWDMKDSAAREAAFNWLAETIELGKQGKKILDEERKAFLTDMRQSAQSSILKGDKLNPAVADNITNLNKGVLKSALLRMRGILSSSLWTTMQRLELIFGEDSKILNHFAEKIINAANLSTDIKRLVEAQKKEALSIIFNSDSKFAHARGIAELQKMKKSGISIRKVVKDEVKLDLETLTKLNDGTMSAETAGLRQDEADAALEEFANNGRKSSVTIEQIVDAGEPVERTMSETQGIQWWLWSMQDASRKQMERDGWDADSFKQLEKFLSPEAKALGRWISGSYQDAADLIEPVYRKLFNAPLPRTKNYSPIHRRNINTSGDIMDMDASDMNSGLAAGFVQARVNTTASLVESDALAVFLAQWENVSHWVSHAELMRDMKGVLLDKDTAVAIRQKKSEGYLQRLKEDIKMIESNGTNSARELVDISRMWRWFMQFRAYKGLAFRISPIIKQTPALLNPLLADVPAHNYMMGMARAFMEPQAFAKEVSAMWSSDIIRRRIESGFSAESRVAMQGSSMTGSQAILAMQAGMMPMSMVDGGWTALGAAISFDYYRRGYMRDNPQMTPELADSAAIARVEKMIATSAQPSDVYARALYERSGNPFMRSMSMFVSDQRKTLAIELMAIRRIATGKSKNKAMDVQRAIVAHVVMASVSQVMAGVIASLLGDDEDRDREWSAEQWTLALALGPINGLFVFGRLIDKIGRGLLGLRVFPNDDLASKAASDLLRGGKNMDELFNPDDPEEFMDALDSASSALGAGMSAAFGPVGGAVDVGANLVREGRKAAKRMSE